MLYKEKNHKKNSTKFHTCCKIILFCNQKYETTQHIFTECSILEDITELL